MTNPDTTEPTQEPEPVAGEPDTAAAPAADDATDSDESGNAEAAKYRRKLRDTEAERDAISARLEVMQRGEAERLAASKLADPQDLWRDGASLADVLDDAGHIDTTKLDTLIGTVLEAHKHWAKQTHPAAAPASEVTSAGKISDNTAPTFVDAFAPRKG